MINNDKAKAENDPDMYDPEDELKKYPQLEETLKIFNNIIYVEYHKADEKANKNHRYHNILAILINVFSTLVVLFAIVQLSGFFSTPWPMWIEILAAITTIVAVIFGVSLGINWGWILERSKAERFRALKFCSIIEPDLWSSDKKSKEKWKEQLCEDIKNINALTFRKLKDASLKEFDVDAGYVINNESSNELIDYYRKKRIGIQLNFFNKRIESKELIDKRIKFIPLIFFFLSILAVFGHFVIDLFFHDLHTVSIILLVLAASFPIVGAGVRLFRSSFEFARSASMYRLKHTALNLLDGKLKALYDGDVKEGGKNGSEVLRTMWQSEQDLHEEHRSWVSLMKEAEWYG